MYTGKTVFTQLLEHLPLHQFRLCVKRYNGNYKVQSFSCLNQYLCLFCVRIRFNHNRSLSCAISMGKVQNTQGCG